MDSHIIEYHVARVREHGAAAAGACLNLVLGILSDVTGPSAETTLRRVAHALLDEAPEVAAPEAKTEMETAPRRPKPFRLHRRDAAPEAEAQEQAPMLAKGERRTCLQCDRPKGATAFVRGSYVCMACEKQNAAKLRS